MIHQYVSIEEVAKYYAVSVSTVRNWVRAGRLSPTDFLKLGNTYRFKLADVDAALRRVPVDKNPPDEATNDAPDEATNDAPDEATNDAPDEVSADPTAPVQLELNFNPDHDV